jgi:hypothetical protein
MNLGETSLFVHILQYASKWSIIALGFDLAKSGIPVRSIKFKFNENS